LGAGRVYACDVDPVAVEIACRNAAVSPVPVGFLVGSAGALASASADVLVANINPEVITDLGPDLLRVVRPGGIVLVSGFERGEIDQVRAAMASAGAEVECANHKGSWSLLAIRTPFRPQ
jgi:ribosomal protein L11 methyltransferase